MPSFTMMDMWREKRKARRKNRGQQVPLQGSFLAAGFCGLAMFASYAERGPDGKPAFARVDAALSGPWARFHVDSAPPGTEEWDATLRRKLHDESPPPFAPPASPAPPEAATCGSAFKVSDDTGFPDLWVTQKTDDENLRMAFFQARRTCHAPPHIPLLPPPPLSSPPCSTCALHPHPLRAQFFVILVTFLGLAVICDDYFMAALEAIIDYLKLKVRSPPAPPAPLRSPPLPPVLHTYRAIPPTQPLHAPPPCPPAGGRRGRHLHGGRRLRPRALHLDHGRLLR